MSAEVGNFMLNRFIWPKVAVLTSLSFFAIFCSQSLQADSAQSGDYPACNLASEPDVSISFQGAYSTVRINSDLAKFTTLFNALNSSGNNPSASDVEKLRGLKAPILEWANRFPNDCQVPHALYSLFDLEGFIPADAHGNVHADRRELAKILNEKYAANSFASRATTQLAQEDASEKSAPLADVAPSNVEIALLPPSVSPALMSASVSSAPVAATADLSSPILLAPPHADTTQAIISSTADSGFDSTGSSQICFRFGETFLRMNESVLLHTQSGDLPVNIANIFPNGTVQVYYPGEKASRNFNKPVSVHNLIIPARAMDPACRATSFAGQPQVAPPDLKINLNQVMKLNSAARTGDTASTNCRADAGVRPLRRKLN